MKKIFTLAVFTALMCFTAKAQLPDGSTAPDFTATDLNGNTWTLYEILDQGKSVIIDLSATWCGPCWSYHQSGALESLFEQYGPDGTDELMVFMIEGDASTNIDCIYDLPGCNSITLGDWTAGTGYPIINDDNIAGMYNLNYWPTLYHICPNRLTTLIPQSSTSEIYDLNGTCAQAFGTNNAGILNYKGFSGPFCKSESFIPTVSIQNLGMDQLTSATLQLVLNENLIQSFDWTGTLNTYQIEEINFDEITITEDAQFEISISLVNGTMDEDDSNNSITSQANLTTAVTDKNYLTLEIKTDPYPGETYWEVRDINGVSFYSGGNDIVVGGTDGSGTYVLGNSVYTHEIPLPSDGCFEFVIFDSYGDGICCIEGDGYYKISDQDGNAILNGGAFEFEKSDPFSLDGASTIENNGAIINYSGEAGTYCGEFTYSPSITLQNLGVNEITSATIEVSSLSGSLLTQDWTGNIQPGQSRTISIEPIVITGSTTVTFSISAINGEPDDLEFKNSVSTEFTNNYTASSTLLLELQLDSYAYEIYWQLTNSSGEVMASGGNELVGPDGGGVVSANTTDPGAYEANAYIFEQIELPIDKNDCYEFLLVDSFGDGVVDGGGGFVNIIDADGVYIIEKNLDDYRFASERILLDVNPIASSVEDLTAVGNIMVFPNPANDELNVSFNLSESKAMKVVIIDVLGKTIKVLANKDFTAGSQNLRTNVADLNSGLYYVQLASGEQRLTQRFTVIK